MFVDDMYGLGCPRLENTVAMIGIMSCKTGEGSSAQNIVCKICAALRDPIRSARHIEVHILQTLAFDKEVGYAIQNTLFKIEKDKTAIACIASKAYTSKLCCEFAAKIDVSAVPIGELQEPLPLLQRSLQNLGYGLYSINCTQDSLDSSIAKS